jgi:hypothetical protein
MMRNKTTLALFLLALAAAVFVTGCNLNQVSISDRIDMFMDDVNSNRGQMYTHLHEDVGDRNLAKKDTYWTPGTPFSATYGTSQSLTNQNKSGDTLTADIVNASGDSVTFEMKEQDPDEWYIRRITFGISLVIVE